MVIPLAMCVAAMSISITELSECDHVTVLDTHLYPQSLTIHAWCVIADVIHIRCSLSFYMRA